MIQYEKPTQPREIPKITNLRIPRTEEETRKLSKPADHDEDRSFKKQILPINFKGKYSPWNER